MVFIHSFCQQLFHMSISRLVFYIESSVDGRAQTMVIIRYKFKFNSYSICLTASTPTHSLSSHDGSTLDNRIDSRLLQWTSDCCQWKSILIGGCPRNYQVQSFLRLFSGIVVIVSCLWSRKKRWLMSPFFLPIPLHMVVFFCCSLTFDTVRIPVLFKLSGCTIAHCTG